MVQGKKKKTQLAITSFFSRHWNFSKKKKTNPRPSFVRGFMRGSPQELLNHKLYPWLSWTTVELESNNQLVMVLRKTNKKGIENALLTSCTQFVRLIIMKSETVCTTNAQIIPIQSPCREKVLQILLMREITK